MNCAGVCARFVPDGFRAGACRPGHCVASQRGAAGGKAASPGSKAEPSADAQSPPPGKPPPPAPLPTFGDKPESAVAPRCAPPLTQGEPLASMVPEAPMAMPPPTGRGRGPTLLQAGDIESSDPARHGRGAQTRPKLPAAAATTTEWAGPQEPRSPLELGMGWVFARPFGAVTTGGSLRGGGSHCSCAEDATPGAQMCERALRRPPAPCTWRCA